MLPYEQLRPRITKKPIIVRFGKPVTMEELTGGVKGGEGYKIGAERLHTLMLALQDNEPCLSQRKSPSPEGEGHM